MKPYARKPKRIPLQVKKDIERTSKIVREDIYDVLKEAWNQKKTKDEAIQAVKDFIAGIKPEAIYEYVKQHKRVEEIVRRVVSDIDSYGLDWSVNEPSRTY